MLEKNDELLVYLIRHGGTSGNEQKRYIGKTDEPLTQNWERKLADMHAPDVDIVYSSPMLRCVQTASILYGKEPDVITGGLRECDFGRFEGKDYIELSSDPDYQRWIDSGGKIGFPEGEDIGEFKKRVVKSFLEDVVADCQHKHFSSAAVVTHGGVIMGLLEKLGDGSIGFFDHMPANGECVKCIYDMVKNCMIVKF